MSQPPTSPALRERYDRRQQEVVTTAAELFARFPELPGRRSVIVVDVERVSSSCGYAVPRMTLDAPRDELLDWATKKDAPALASYWREKNARSIDGLPTGLLDDVSSS